MDMTMANWIPLILSNFPISMFVLALLFMLINRLVTGGRVPGAEIAYRWTAFFVTGLTGVYAFIMHVFFPEIAASAIGWTSSPFQYEVGIGDLAFGMLAIFSFNASYAFRLATVMVVTICLWGDAIGHIYQMVKFQNYSLGNAGSWFWMDILIPLLLITCIRKIKPVKKIFQP